MLKRIVVLVAALSVFAGCGVLEERNSSARLATMYATLKVIDEDPGKAERVIEIATSVRAFASDQELLTIEILIRELRGYILFDRLDAADQLLVTTLVDQLQIELTDRLGADVLPEDLRLAVDTVAEWVILAAQMQR